MKKLFIFIIIYAIIALLVFSTKTNKIKEHMTVNVDDYKFIGFYKNTPKNIPSNYIKQSYTVSTINSAKEYAANNNASMFCFYQNELYFMKDINKDLINFNSFYPWDSSEIIDTDYYVCNIWVNRNLLTERQKIIYDSINLESDYVNIGCYYDNSIFRTMNRQHPSNCNNWSNCKNYSIYAQQPIFGLQHYTFGGFNELYYSSNLNKATQLGVASNSDCKTLNSGFGIAGQNNIWVNRKMLSADDKILYDQILSSPRQTMVLTTDYVNIGCYLDINEDNSNITTKTNTYKNAETNLSTSRQNLTTKQLANNVAITNKNNAWTDFDSKLKTVLDNIESYVKISTDFTNNYNKLINDINTKEIPDLERQARNIDARNTPLAAEINLLNDKLALIIANGLHQYQNAANGDIEKARLIEVNKLINQNTVSANNYTAQATNIFNQIKSSKDIDITKFVDEAKAAINQAKNDAAVIKNTNKLNKINITYRYTRPNTTIISKNIPRFENLMLTIINAATSAIENNQNAINALNTAIDAPSAVTTTQNELNTAINNVKAAEADLQNASIDLAQSKKALQYIQPVVTSVEVAKTNAARAGAPIFGLQNGGTLYFGGDLAQAIVQGKDTKTNCSGTNGLGTSLSNNIWVNPKLLTDADKKILINLMDSNIRDVILYMATSSSITVNITDYINIGCYTDDNNNDRMIPLIHSSGLSIDNAKQTAATSKIPIFGFKPDGGTLYFGINLNKLNNAGKLGYNRSGELPCSNTTNSIWVNRNLLSEANKKLYDVILYRTRALTMTTTADSSEYVYIGCYIDNPDRIIPLKWRTLESSSLSSASGRAAAYKIPVYSVKNNGELFFGIDLAYATKLNKDPHFNCTSQVNITGSSNLMTNNIWANRKLLSPTDQTLYDRLMAPPTVTTNPAIGVFTNRRSGFGGLRGW